MLFYVIVGFFAAVGFVTLLWLCLGGFLPGAKTGEVAILCQPGREYALISRYNWLRNLALVRCRLVLLDSQLPPEVQEAFTEQFPGVAFSTLAQWQEKERQ